MSSPLHYWLGGSIAARAIACPGSLQYKSSGSSLAADRGSLLHEAVTHLATGKFKRAEDAVGHRGYQQQVTSSDAQRALVPAHHALKKWLGGRTPQFEVKVKFKSIREAGGTADVLVPNGIADFKFGSRPVSATKNKQLIFYLAAAIESGKVKPHKVYDIAIIQPDVQKLALTDTVTVDEVEEFTATLREAAQNARSKSPRFAAGDHCTFCPARQTCKVRLELPFAALKAALANLT